MFTSLNDANCSKLYLKNPTSKYSFENMDLLRTLENSKKSEFDQNNFKGKMAVSALLGNRIVLI